MFLSRSFCFTIIFFSSAIFCQVQICDFEDEECLKRNANKLFKSFIADIPEEVCSDPLHLDLVVAKLPTIKYTMHNVSLSGIKNCYIDLLRINKKDCQFDLHLDCPYLLLETEVITEGCIGPEFVIGETTARHDYYDYNFLVHGNYKEYEKHGNYYLSITDYVLDIKAEGRVHYYCEGLYFGDEKRTEKLLKFVNKHWSFVDKVIRRPYMEAFMEKLIKNGNAFLEVTPIEILFPR